MYLYGAGGHARAIMDIFNSLGGVKTINGVYDDNPETNLFSGIPVKHNLAGVDKMIICIGKNSTRKQIACQLQEKGIGTACAIHPSAIVSPHAEIGEGTVVMAGAIINSGARIGRHCIINSGAVVEHDCLIGDYSHIASHATLGGGVNIGEGCLICAGAVVTLGLCVGEWSVIGAGAVVVRNIPENVMAFGSPCRIVRELQP